MTEPTDAERAEFEAWAIAEYISVNRSLDGTDGYFEGDSQIAWAAWQAARRTPTPQPTQAQAGAVPLTDEQSHELLERMATEADQWAEGLSYEPTREQLSGWCVAFIQREIQAAHGIKGADHGVADMKG